MTAFSTGVICQPLLALQLTKEIEAGERAGEAGDGVMEEQRGELDLFHSHKLGCNWALITT